MKTVWLKSSASGKWYYLNPTSNGCKGAMLTNPIIDGYRIGYYGRRTNQFTEIKIDIYTIFNDHWPSCVVQ